MSGPPPKIGFRKLGAFEQQRQIVVFGEGNGVADETIRCLHGPRWCVDQGCPGFRALLGENGVGKSTLVNASWATTARMKVR